MVRTILAMGLVANGALFAWGIWRSVVSGNQAFHSLGELLPSLPDSVAVLWIWPMSLLTVCGLIVLVNRQNPIQPSSDENDHELS